MPGYETICFYENAIVQFSDVHTNLQGIIKSKGNTDITGPESNLSRLFFFMAVENLREFKS